MRLPLLLVAPALLTLEMCAHSQGARACTVQPAREMTAGEKALRDGNNDAALEAFRADLKSADSSQKKAAATAGMLHALNAPGTMSEALQEASKAYLEFSTDAGVLEAVGSIRYRHGETAEAARVWSAAGKLDPCNPRLHYDMARFLRLNGMYASGQREMGVAHKLAPNETAYADALRRAVASPQDANRVAEDLKAALAKSGLSVEERAKTEKRLEIAQAVGKGDCELATPLNESVIPMFGDDSGAGNPRSLNVDIFINGKRARVLVDTGASGLIISRAAAMRAGLLGEADIEIGGIGDDGLVGTKLAHAQSLRINKLEFRNCLVQYIAKKDALGDIDGIMGPDVFSQYLVTLDLPRQEIHLGPLPRRPSDTEATEHTALNISGEDLGVPRDRYVSPEMATWTKAFRKGGHIILPTRLNNGPSRLFVLDTGAVFSTISPEAAKDVTTVMDRSKSGIRMSGITGEVKEMNSARVIEMSFANVQQKVTGMISFDMSKYARTTDVEISGLIGFDALQNLAISIDYRDNLVNFSSDRKGSRAR